MKQYYTLEEAVENHRKLWYEIHRILKEESDIETYIGLDPERTEISPYIKIRAMRNVFDSEYKEDDIKSDCFLCQYKLEESNGTCVFCPLDTKGSTRCLNGLYNLFRLNIIDALYEDAARTALQIAELPIINRRGEE